MTRAVDSRRAASCLAHHTHPVCKQSLRRAYLSPESLPCPSVSLHPLLHLFATAIHQCTLSSCLTLPRLYQQQHRFALAATTAYPLLSRVKGQTHRFLCLAADRLGSCGAAQQRHLDSPASICTTPAHTLRARQGRCDFVTAASPHRRVFPTAAPCSRASRPVAPRARPLLVPRPSGLQISSW